LNVSPDAGSRRRQEGLFSAISAGFFLVLAGMFFVTVPNLYNEIVKFFSDISTQPLVQVPNVSNISLPVPHDPHSVVYTTVMQFCLIWGIFLAALLTARFFAHSPTRRKANNLGDILFWLGAAYVSEIWLVNSGSVPVSVLAWFEFWAAIIILVGVSLIVRAIFLAAAWMTRA
jgi:hypothetical protein